MFTTCTHWEWVVGALPSHHVHKQRNRPERCADHLDRVAVVLAHGASVNPGARFGAQDPRHEASPTRCESVYFFPFFPRPLVDGVVVTVARDPLPLEVGRSDHHLLERVRPDRAIDQAWATPDRVVHASRPLRRGHVKAGAVLLGDRPTPDGLPVDILQPGLLVAAESKSEVGALRPHPRSIAQARRGHARPDDLQSVAFVQPLNGGGGGGGGFDGPSAAAMLWSASTASARCPTHRYWSHHNPCG